MSKEKVFMNYPKKGASRAVINVIAEVDQLVATVYQVVDNGRRRVRELVDLTKGRWGEDLPDVEEFGHKLAEHGLPAARDRVEQWLLVEAYEKAATKMREAIDTVVD